VNKLVHCEDKIKANWLSDFGNFNRLPQPWREIDVNEYIHKSFSYCVQYEDFRQPLDAKGGFTGGLYIYWYPTYGIGVRPPNKWKLKDGKIVYTEPFKYYYFGCEHKYKELSQENCRKAGIYHAGRCYHVYQCSQCGNIESQDSSD
jgi:hypothetical protein